MTLKDPTGRRYTLGHSAKNRASTDSRERPAFLNLKLMNTDYDESEDYDKEARAIAGTIVFWSALIAAGVIGTLLYCVFAL